MSISSRSGQYSFWMGMLLLVTGVVTSLGFFLAAATKGASRKIVSNRASVRNASTAETVLVAYRLTEIAYLSFASTCESAKPFLSALASGSGCPGTFVAFDPSDTQNVGVRDGLYRFSEPGCRITQTASTCGMGRTEILTGGLDTLLTGAAGSIPFGYRVTLDSVQPAKGLAEFSMELREGERVQRIAFAIRTPLSNSAHLEADGRITQSSPDPLATCRGTEWASLLLFDPASRRCVRFAQAGGGTGLAVYQDRFFGLRPDDGQIVDMTALTEGDTYLVNPGSGKPNFVPYDRSQLVNVDDITLIARQIYYVANFGVRPELGYLDMNGIATRVRLCDLYGMGWAQSYEGIAAHGSSDPLFPESQDGIPSSAVRIATFYLKTSSGDLLTGVVQSWPSGGAPPGLRATQIGGRSVSCHVYKDQTLQRYEFARTYGFDRVPGSKPYLVY